MIKIPKLIQLEHLQLFKRKQDEFNKTQFLKTSDKGTNIATLVGGKIPTSQLPAIAITDVFIVNNQDEMLKLAAQKGDVCIRTDVKKTFILKTDDPKLLENWAELPTPTDAVTSVNGMTGVVVIPNATIGKEGLMSSSDKQKLDGLKNYTLPKATNSLLGGVIIGTGITVNDGTISVQNASQSINGLMLSTDKKKLDDMTYATEDEINAFFS